MNVQRWSQLALRHAIEQVMIWCLMIIMIIVSITLAVVMQIWLFVEVDHADSDDTDVRVADGHDAAYVTNDWQIWQHWGSCCFWSLTENHRENGNTLGMVLINSIYTLYILI